MEFFKVKINTINGVLDGEINKQAMFFYTFVGLFLLFIFTMMQVEQNETEKVTDSDESSDDSSDESSNESSDENEESYNDSMPNVSDDEVNSGPDDD